MDNDYELTYLVKEGNEEAYGLLINKYKPLVFKIVTKYFSLAINRGISYDDLNQEALIAFYDALTKYDENSSKFNTFLYLCVERRITKYIFKSGRKKYFLLNEACHIDEYDEETFFNSQNYELNKPENLIIDNELERKIINFKNDLNYLDAAIFDLRYSYFSYSEIGILLDIPYKQVDNRLLSIKKKLKTYLNLNN